MTSSVNSTNASYNFSVESFVRNQVANWCGPTKPVKPKKPEEGADYKAQQAYNTALESFRKADRKFPKELEVFVYNTTANIANGAVVVAIVTAALAIFTSVIGPFFAFVVIGASALIHWDARNSLPAFEFGWENNTELHVSVACGEENLRPVEQIFGLPSANFESSDKKTQWKPVAFAAASTPIWFNTLPTAKPAQKTEQQNEAEIQGEELENPEPPTSSGIGGGFNLRNFTFGSSSNTNTGK